MMYNTSNPLEAQNLRLRVDKLIAHGEMVELISKKPRSLKANAYLHTILSYFGLQTGNTLEEVKSYYFKRVVNSDLFMRHKHDDILGDDRIYLLSTTKLTQEELSLAIDRFRNWSADKAGIYIPSSEEYIALLHIQHDIDNAKNYL